MMPITNTAFTSLFTGVSLIVAFFGGMVMLFAPCCITLMLPAYLGTVFKSRSKVMLMTLVFATGVATIILPLVLGARFLASFFNNYHIYVFAGGSLLMIVIGMMSLFNKTIELPFISKIQAPKVTNIGTTYLLGVVSGISSTCCAPVLFGALSLAALSPTMLIAAGVGLAYTFGIVFPLFLLSLLFEKGIQKRMVSLRTKTLKLGDYQFPISNFISFLIFTTTGIIFLILALTDRLQMNEQAINLSIKFKAWVDAITMPIRNIPYSEPLFAILLLGIFIYFIYLGTKNSKDKNQNNN